MENRRAGQPCRLPAYHCREEGAESWPRLKIAVETAAQNRDERAAQLERAVTNGNFLLLDRLLSLDPSLADAHFGLRLALARREPALADLKRDPHLRPGRSARVGRYITFAFRRSISAIPTRARSWSPCWRRWSPPARM